jgi:hypothetical protein
VLFISSKLIIGNPISNLLSEMANCGVRELNLILASDDRVAMDVESIKVVANFECSKLADDPWSYSQI